jgi:Flp pilus assembly pilin Flp
MAQRNMRQWLRGPAAFQRCQGGSTTIEYAILIGIGLIGLIIAIGAVGNMTTDLFADAERGWNVAGDAPTPSMQVTIELEHDVRPAPTPR